MPEAWLVQDSLYCRSDLVGCGLGRQAEPGAMGYDPGSSIKRRTDSHQCSNRHAVQCVQDALYDASLPLIERAETNEDQRHPTTGRPRTAPAVGWHAHVVDWCTNVPYVGRP